MYDLTIEGEHEFFAAGLLVHNCRVHHVGYFGDLESQLVTWVPGDTSPDRLDALVWGVRFLFPSMTQAPAQVTSPTRREGASWQPGR